ncbi:MAG: carboxyl-terminal processing protease [Planctomycetota bacterium]|jgi:carboxyl-terminal processing protease
MINHRILAFSLCAAPLTFVVLGMKSSSTPLTPEPAAVQASMSSEDMAQLLLERAKAAKEMSIGEVWVEASKIIGILQLGDDLEAKDDTLDKLLADPDALGEHGVLLFSAVRLEGETPDYSVITSALRPLLASSDQDIRRASASLFEASEFSQIDVDDLRDLIKELLAGAEDIDNEPHTRLAFASSAHAQGGGAIQRDARKVILSYLDSSSPELRGLGALALAGIGDLETARPELEKLASQPGTVGQLASAFLKNDELRNWYESRMRAQRQSQAKVMDENAPAEDLQAIDHMIQLITERHIEGDVVNREELLDAAMNGMLQSLDRHSTYMNSETFETFNQDLQGEYGGIGAYVAIDRSDNLFTITQPIYSGPAYKADLRSDDKIIQIDDWPTHDHGMSKDQNDIIRRLKGKPDTDVKLYIWRRGMNPELIDRPTEDMAVTVRRGFITIPTVKSDMLPGQIGLVQLDQFSGVASQEVLRATRELLSEGAESIILDLRSNPGGLLSEARNVADLFLPEGKRVVSTESRLEAEEVLMTRRPSEIPEEMPVVVLINRFSASASEIVSGALQDHGRAPLVGQRSFGKGSVQNLVSLGQDDRYDDENRNRNHDNWEKLTKDWDGDGEFDYAPRAKLTIARYLLPSGRSIHRELDDEGNIQSLGGVSPEFVVQPKRYDAWRLEAMYDLQDKRVVREWVKDNWDSNKELFVQLAYTDGKDPDRYPGFDEFYSGLNSPLSREDVRFMLRSEIRRLAQDARGSSFPRGDFEEDVQLQKAIDVSLEKLGKKSDDIPEYRATFEVGEDLTGRDVTTNRPGNVPEQQDSVRYAMGLIADASKANGSLSKKQLEELLNILSEIDR